MTPEPGETTDVHLYLGYERPCFPHEEKARANNAVLGPLRNRADEYLTGLVTKAPLRHGAPSGVMGPGPTSDADRVRGFGGAIDSAGFLWLQEQWLSGEALQSGEN